MTHGQILSLLHPQFSITKTDFCIFSRPACLLWQSPFFNVFPKYCIDCHRHCFFWKQEFRYFFRFSTMKPGFFVWLNERMSISWFKPVLVFLSDWIASFRFVRNFLSVFSALNCLCCSFAGSCITAFSSICKTFWSTLHFSWLISK